MGAGSDAADQNAMSSSPVPPAQVADSLKKMARVVNNLVARADCVPFREPVDWKGLQLHDYPKIIKVHSLQVQGIIHLALTEMTPQPEADGSGHNK
ncbi:hypothetical protein THAOC_19707, partial [Thalassiosira oceanica]